MSDEEVTAEFENYSNHTRGITGRYIASAITAGVKVLKVALANGDEIKFYPWNFWNDADKKQHRNESGGHRTGGSDLSQTPSQVLEVDGISKQGENAGEQDEIARLASLAVSLGMEALDSRTFILPSEVIGFCFGPRIGACTVAIFREKQDR